MYKVDINIMPYKVILLTHVMFDTGNEYRTDSPGLQVLDHHRGTSQVPN